MTAEPRTYGYDDAAVMLGVGRRTLQRLVAEGSIRHIKMGRRVRFREQDIDAFLEAEARGGRPIYADTVRHQRRTG